MISSKPCYVPTTTSNDQQSCFWNGNDRDDARPGTETTSTSIHSLTHNISLMMAMYLLLRRFAGKNQPLVRIFLLQQEQQEKTQEKHQKYTKKRRRKMPKTTKKRGERETKKKSPEKKNEKRAHTHQKKRTNERFPLQTNEEEKRRNPPMK